MKVLFLPRYGQLGASSRLRLCQYIDMLISSGIHVDTKPLVDDCSLKNLYATKRYKKYSLLISYLDRFRFLLNLSKYDFVFIEKELFPYVPAFVEHFLLKKIHYGLDYDDAVFHNYDKNQNFLIRFFLGTKIDVLMRKSSLVVVGNSYIEQRAIESGAHNIKRLPTVVDLIKYPRPLFDSVVNKSKTPRIVWIGSPATVHYLELIKEQLKELATTTNYVLRIIGANFSLDGVNVELLDWSSDTESQYISDSDVGIMPLCDNDWERGKCGYKLIQYMACCLPVVASPVGINNDIVKNGQNGFLAEFSEDWVKHLKFLLNYSLVRLRMGSYGRLMVEKEYSVKSTAPKLISFLYKFNRSH